MKYALITGCSVGGIGSALVEAFHKRNVHVFATARTPSKMSHLEVSPNVTLLKLDVLSAEDIAGAVEFVRIKTGGKLDYLVNNSGTGYTRPILDLDMKTAKYVFDVNVWAVVEITRAFVPLLIASKGSVVNISSVVAVTVTPYLGVYSASKAALTLLSETLRVELEPFGVSVITLMTGAVKSNQFANDPCPGLPDDSMYKPVEKQLESITDFDSFPRQTAAKYAKNVVSDVLGGETGKIWRGMGASVAWFGSRFLPDFLLASYAMRRSGLSILASMSRTVKA